MEEKGTESVWGCPYLAPTPVTLLIPSTPFWHPEWSELPVILTSWESKESHAISLGRSVHRGGPADSLVVYVIRSYVLGCL